MIASLLVGWPEAPLTGSAGERGEEAHQLMSLHRRTQ